MKRSLILLLLAAAACTSKTTVVRPTPSFTTSLPPNADEWSLRYRLLEQFKPLFFCDPFIYPLAMNEGEALRRARLWWLEGGSEAPETKAAIRHLGMREPLTDAQIRVAYIEHWRLRSVQMKQTPAGFRFLIDVGETDGPVTRVEGTISRDGLVAIRSRELQRDFYGCPICLQGATRIASPHGWILTAHLRVGDLVWTRDLLGRRKAVPVIRVVKRRVATLHPMMRLRLTDGRILVASASHPDVTGKALGTMSPNDVLDGARIAEARTTWVHEAYTYDLLPDGPTGDYLANGIWLGSTLSRRLGASRSAGARSF